MEIVVGVLVVVVALYFIAAPFLEEEPLTEGVALELDNIQENEKEAYIKSLEDLEADFRMKKITEEDYTEAKEEVRKEAGKLLD
jgi:hypothetical protein